MLTYAQCEACSGIMFLTLVEPHPTTNHAEFRVFECADCTAIMVFIPDIEAVKGLPIPANDYWQRRNILSTMR
jgi:hypothetical protein